MKQTIRLTESDLRKIVRHTITEALDEITGKQRNVIVRNGKDSAQANIMGSPTLPSGRSTERTLNQVARMDDRSLYMMLSDFKGKPFSFALNYQGVDVVMDFYVENMTQANSQFTVIGTMFMRNGAKILGKIVIDIVNDTSYIKIRGDRHPYRFEPTHNSIEYWNSFVNELKNSVC